MMTGHLAVECEMVAVKQSSGGPGADACISRHPAEMMVEMGVRVKDPTKPDSTSAT
jgi:hypothetical protein